MMTDKRNLIGTAPVLEMIGRTLTREQCDPREHPAVVESGWARRQLAACRTVLFAMLVDDPLALVEEFPDAEAQAKEQARLMEIMGRLADPGNVDDERVLAEAREEVRRSNVPPVPPDTDDIATIFRHALNYHGYERHADVAAVARECRKRREEAGRWQGALPELRGTLFFAQRSVHFASGLLSVTYVDANGLSQQHAFEDVPGKEEIVLLRELYRAIRAQWHEVEPEPASVLDPFRPGWLGPRAQGVGGAEKCG
jgi:hypothetical protein